MNVEVGFFLGVQKNVILSQSERFVVILFCFFFIVIPRAQTHNWVHFNSREMGMVRYGINMGYYKIFA